MKILIGLLVLSVIVIVHEFGHYIFARRAGIRVEEFCIGLGPRLFYKKRGETIWSLKLFPIGGACIMTGEDDDSNSESETHDSGSFQAKTVGQRMSVVLAGPFFNFFLAFLLASVIIGFTGVQKPVVSEVVVDSPAQKAGIVPGDMIKSVGGHKVKTFKDLVLRQFEQGQKTTEFVIERDGVEKMVSVTPELVDKRPLIGIKSGEVEKVGPLATIGYGAHEVRYVIDSVIIGLKKIVTGQVSRNDIAGPIGIANIIGDSVSTMKDYGIGALLIGLGSLTVLISANLGMMNLLPIPALDGGRFLFLLVELIRGKRLNAKIEGYVNLAGFALLMGLMVFLFYNDIVNLFH